MATHTGTGGRVEQGLQVRKGGGDRTRAIRVLIGEVRQGQAFLCRSSLSLIQSLPLPLILLPLLMQHDPPRRPRRHFALHHRSKLAAAAQLRHGQR